ncbi:RNA polymerase sigma factor [Paraliomyxa miuraensis]|uniref:RNA polymerase sigma factor n=1 Tax=Paraliomyxa miuraensis TaxID=376150 RepID=UPI00225BDBB2|nr:RNA polymerase sigma factor [Paraliomyxa miuraensis]MCX4245125.1 RNA polymerase sigma factor [Paraliomyxa miuraensis]
MARAREADAIAVLIAAQRGDPAAQSALFSAHRDDVARQIQRMTGDASIVDDLVQEVFISAFSALPGFRRDARLDTWLYRITVNKVRNWWDAKRRRLRREDRVATSPSEPVATPEDQATTTEHLGRLYAALGELPDKYREAFTARAIDNLSLQEASERLGVPVSTVSYRTRKAEERLCTLLGLDPEEAR